MKRRAGSWSLRALRLQSDCGPPFPIPLSSPPLAFPLLYPGNGGDMGDDMSPHNGVWGGAAAANEIPCILVEI